MRSDPRRAFHLAVGGLVAAVVLAAGCSGADDGPRAEPAPTDGERAACAQVQGLVDAIVASESMSAMQGLTQLEQALAASGNDTLSDNGRAFFATISGTVPDPGQLTVEETAAVGDRALAEAQPRLQALLDECDDLGLTISNLPTPEGRP